MINGKKQILEDEEAKRIIEQSNKEAEEMIKNSVIKEDDEKVRKGIEDMQKKYEETTKGDAVDEANKESFCDMCCGSLECCEFVAECCECFGSL